MSSQSRERPLRAISVRLGAVAFLVAAVGFAQTCEEDLVCGFNECRSPARPVPAVLWGELEPVDPDPLPANRDTTDFNTVGFPNATYPYWMDIDTENDWIFAAIASGFQIWNTTNPESPSLVSMMDGRGGDWPYWPLAGDHDVYAVRAIDAAEGTDDLRA